MSSPMVTLASRVKNDRLSLTDVRAHRAMLEQQKSDDTVDDLLLYNTHSHTSTDSEEGAYVDDYDDGNIDYIDDDEGSHSDDITSSEIAASSRSVPPLTFTATPPSVHHDHVLGPSSPSSATNIHGGGYKYISAMNHDAHQLSLARASAHRVAHVRHRMAWPSYPHVHSDHSSSYALRHRQSPYNQHYMAAMTIAKEEKQQLRQRRRTKLRDKPKQTQHKSQHSNDVDDDPLFIKHFTSSYGKHLTQEEASARLVTYLLLSVRRSPFCPSVYLVDEYDKW
jgi:hypothetical protein